MQIQYVDCVDAIGQPVRIKRLQKMVKSVALAGETYMVQGCFTYQTMDGQWVNTEDDVNFTCKDGRTLRRK